MKRLKLFLNDALEKIRLKLTIIKDTTVGTLDYQQKSDIINPGVCQKAVV